MTINASNNNIFFGSKKSVSIAGLNLDTYCMRYSHAMPFLNFYWQFKTLKILNLHDI